MILETMPLVVVKYCGLQEGFAQLAPQALFNVVGGEVPELLRSTVTLESLFAKGYRVKELKPELTNAENFWVRVSSVSEFWLNKVSRLFRKEVA